MVLRKKFEQKWIEKGIYSVRSVALPHWADYNKRQKKEKEKKVENFFLFLSLSLVLVSFLAGINCGAFLIPAAVLLRTFPP